MLLINCLGFVIELFDGILFFIFIYIKLLIELVFLSGGWFVWVLNY